MDRIIRIRQNKDFTIVPNQVFKSELSYKAIGLLTYILHLPDDWKLYKTYLYKTSPKDGRSAIDAAWDELELAGFIDNEIATPKGKKLPEINYIVYDSPQKDVAFKHAQNQHPKKKIIKYAENKHVENKHVENPQLINTNQTNTNQTNTYSNKDSVTNVTVPKTVYQQFIDIYDIWFKKNNDGVPPKFDGAGGNAAKALIGYFKTIVRARAKTDQITLDDDGEANRILESWKLVLDNWGKLEPFYQDKTRLIDINSNIQNIIKQVKNGARNTGKQSVDQHRASVQDEFNRRFGNKQPTGPIS